MSKTTIQIGEAWFIDALFPNAGVKPRIISIMYDQVNERLMLAIDGLPAEFSGGLRTIEIATNIGGVPFVYDLPRVGDGTDGGEPMEPPSAEPAIPTSPNYSAPARNVMLPAAQLYTIHGANAL